MSQQLYQYSVVYKDPKDSKKSEVVTPVTQALANDVEHAKRMALVALDAKWHDKLEDLEVTVVPFR